MSVIVSVRDLGPCQKEVKVAVPAPAVEAESRRVTDEFRKKVRLPGFRKGKVPRAIVESRFAEEIERQVVERLVPRFWQQAEAEEQLEPLLAPELGEVDFADEGELTFVATVDLAPEIELRNIRDFDLPSPDVVVGEAEIEEAFEDLRRRAASWKPAGRPAATGDRVTADIVELGGAGEGGEAPQPREAAFEIGAEGVWEELGLAASGATPGQTVRFEKRFGEGEAGVVKRFEARVGAVEERDLPALDDAFAARVGDYADLAALRADVAAGLERAKRAEVARRRETALVEQLLERHPFELPPRLVEHEVERSLSEYASSLAERGVDIERAGIDWRRLATEVRPQAEKRVRAELLVDAIAETEGIEVGEEELEAALGQMARAAKTSAGAMRLRLDRAGRLQALRRQLRREKTVRRLLGENPDEDESGSAAAADPQERS